MDYPDVLVKGDRLDLQDYQERLDRPEQQVNVEG